MRETQKSVTAFEVQQSKTRKILKNNLGKRRVKIPRARASLWLWDYNQMPLTMVILFFLFDHSSLFAGRPLWPCTGTCLVYLNTHSDLQISICCQSRNKKRKIKESVFCWWTQEAVLEGTIHVSRPFLLQPNPQNWNKRHRLLQVKPS